MGLAGGQLQAQSEQQLAPQPQLLTPLSRTWALPAPRRQRPGAPGPGKAKSTWSLPQSNVPPTDLGSFSDQGLEVTSHVGNHGLVSSNRFVLDSSRTSFVGAGHADL